MEFPDKKTSPNQRYRITVTGMNLLKLIHNNKINMANTFKQIFSDEMNFASQKRHFDDN